MQARTTPTTPRYGVTPEPSATFRLPRRHLAPFRVSLHPLFRLSNLVQATGFLARATRSGNPVDPEHGPAILRWTVEAVDLLQPRTTVAFALPPEAVLSPGFAGQAESLDPGRVVLVFEAARVGQRRRLLEEATRTARRRGMKVAITGHRVSSAEGFDAIVVRPGSASEFLPRREDVSVIAADLRSARHLQWARELHADLIEGPFLADRMEVVPVDVGRPLPPSLNGDGALTQDAPPPAGDVDHGRGQPAW